MNRYATRAVSNMPSLYHKTTTSQEKSWFVDNLSVFIIMRSKPHIWKTTCGIEHKQCHDCKEFKPVTTEFYYFRKIEPCHPYAACKVCTKLRAATRARGRRRRRKLEAIEYKGGKCQDCQQTFPVCVFDFHHVDPSQKDFTIGEHMDISEKKLRAELDKCVLLCSNCHRMRHDT